MKNPNSPINRLKASLKNRWSSEDYPGGEPRFQLALLGKDIAVFVVLPVISIILFRACEGGDVSKKRSQPQQVRKADPNQNNVSKSQIIDFDRPNRIAGELGSKKSVGTLVRVKLLNVVETYSTAPVHAQIVDNGLGVGMRGGILIGDATSDSSFDRINITFRHVRDPNNESLAYSISARALSLDGTLGLDASKKEGYVARATIESASSLAQSVKTESSDSDLKSILLRALSAGLIQEFGTKSQVEKNRAQVLSLKPSTVFFVELSEPFNRSTK